MSIFGLVGVSLSMILYHFLVKKKMRPPMYMSMSGWLWALTSDAWSFIGAINTVLLKFLDAEIVHNEETVQVQTAPGAESTELLDKS